MLDREGHGLRNAEGKVRFVLTLAKIEAQPLTRLAS
jgi:hypothetical protein